jgi:hypothetical protein
MTRLTTYAAALLTAGWAAGACAPAYTRAEVVYAEPADHVYVVPVDRVVVVSREVLVQRGWVVQRVEQRGPDRVIWARRGDDEIVRIFATHQGDRVVLRGLNEARERGDDRGHDCGKHKGWVRRGNADDVIADIDVRLRSH